MSTIDEPQGARSEQEPPQGPGVELGAGEPTTFEPEEDPDADDEGAGGTGDQQQG